MSVATIDRAASQKDGKYYSAVPMAAAVNVPAGTVGTVSTAGLAGPSSNATYNRVLGLVERGADNTAGAASALTVDIRRDIAAVFENDVTNPVLVDHIGQTVKWVDNQTCAAPATASLPSGGVIQRVDSAGVLVYFP